MRRGAGLYTDKARRQLVEKGHHLAPPQLLAEDDFASLIDAVNLKHALRNIQTDRANLHLGRLPFYVVLNSYHIGTLMPCGAPSTASKLAEFGQPH